MSGGGSFGYSNANSKSRSEYQNGSDFRQQVNPYQQGYLNNMMSQAQSTFAKYNRQFDKNTKSANTNQGAIFDMAKSGLMNMLNGGAYTSPEGNQIRNHIMGQFNPVGMQSAATPNYQQFGIGNGTPVGMNPFLTGGSKEGQIPNIGIPMPRPGIQPGFAQPQGSAGPALEPMRQHNGFQQPQIAVDPMAQQQPMQMNLEELARKKAMFGWR